MDLVHTTSFWQDFPIKSTLDQKEFGNPKSAITKDIIEQGIKNIEGGHLSVQKVDKSLACLPEN